MNDLNDLLIAKINKKRKEGICLFLNEDNAKLILSMINGLIDRNMVNTNSKQRGEVIFLEAPTGSGKDNIFLQLLAQHPEKKYIELNMDMFRKYYKLFLKDSDKLRDLEYSKKTNQFTYEIFIVLQEILVEFFPGTNIVVSGTLRDIDWNLELMQYYKKHDYIVKLITLTISRKEGLFSIIKRYVEAVDRKRKDASFQKGTARYTSFNYFNDTYEKFINNFSYFTNLFFANPGELIDVIEIYRRNNSLIDFNDNNLVYSSEIDKDNPIEVIKELRNKEYILLNKDFNELICLIKKNYDYLYEQDTLMDILWTLSYLNNSYNYDEENKLCLSKEKM